MKYEGIEDEAMFLKEFESLLECLKRQKGMCPEVDRLLESSAGQPNAKAAEKLRAHTEFCGECLWMLHRLMDGSSIPGEEGIVKQWSETDQRMTERMQQFLATRRPAPAAPALAVSQAAASVLQPAQPIAESARKPVVAPMPAVSQAIAASAPKSAQPSSEPVQKPAEAPAPARGRFRHFLRSPGLAYAACGFLLIASSFLLYTVATWQRTRRLQQIQIAQVREQNQALSREREALAEQNRRQEAQVMELAQRDKPVDWAYTNPFSYQITVHPQRPSAEHRGKKGAPVKMWTVKIPIDAQLLDLRINMEDNRQYGPYRIEISDESGTVVFEGRDLRKDGQGLLPLAIPKDRLEAKDYGLKIYYTGNDRSDWLAEHRLQISR